MLTEAFRYDPAEKDYYIKKVMEVIIPNDNKYVMLVLTKAIESDSVNEQYYNMLIQKARDKKTANNKTKWTIFLVIIGTILIAII